MQKSIEKLAKVKILGTLKRDATWSIQNLGTLVDYHFYYDCELCYYWHWKISNRALKYDDTKKF